MPWTKKVENLWLYLSVLFDLFLTEHDREGEQKYGDVISSHAGRKASPNIIC